MARRHVNREQKSCFIVAAIGKPESPERKHSDTVLSKLFEPVLEDLGYGVYRGDESHTLDIHQAIVEDLAQVPLVIADLTFANPNVMFEVGIRLAWCLPIILVAHERERAKLSFDVQGLRVIFYKHPRKLQWRRKAQQDLRERILAILPRYKPVRIFRELFTDLAQPVGAQILCNAVRLAIHDLMRSLRDLKPDIEREYETRRRDAIKVLGELIAKPFAALDHKAHFFQGIADEVDDKTLDHVMSDCVAIKNEWKKFNDELLEKRATQETLDWVAAEVDRLIKVVKRKRRAIPR